MQKLTLLFLSLIFINCKSQSNGASSNQVEKSPIEIVMEKEQKALERTYDNLGELVSTISFVVMTDNKNDFPDGFVPWANIEDPEKDLPNLLDKDDVVIEESPVKIIIDYPVTNPYEFTLESTKGFTRKQLLEEISRHYFRMYEEEEQSATIKTIPLDKRTKMVNRNQTDGKYGIWGHDIRDLDLSLISVYKTKENEIVLVLNIES